MNSCRFKKKMPGRKKTNHRHSLQEKVRGLRPKQEATSTRWLETTKYKMASSLPDGSAFPLFKRASLWRHPIGYVLSSAACLSPFLSTPLPAWARCMLGSQPSRQVFQLPGVPCAQLNGGSHKMAANANSAGGGGGSLPLFDCPTWWGWGRVPLESGETACCARGTAFSLGGGAAS